MSFGDIAKTTAAAGVPKIGLPVGGLSFLSGSGTQPITTSFYDSDSKIKILKSLTQIDPFIAWEALDLSEYSQKFLYEFVILNDGSVEKTFVFPINPQNITINVPAAVNVTATMRGILEEHNGAPLRQISIAGTTGVSPKNVISRDKPESESSLLTGLGKALFGDTIKAAQRTIKAAEETINAMDAAISGQGPEPKYNNAITSNLDVKKLQAELSLDYGYQTIHELARFLDFYLAKKKTSTGKNYRLVFQMHKDKMYYDVTLNNFSFIKSAGTLEYNYSLNLTAWKRRASPVGIRKAKTVDLGEQTKLDIGQRLGMAVNAIKKGRKTIAEAQGVLSAIKSDFQQVVNNINEAVLLSNDIIGLAISVVDFVGFGDPNNSVWSYMQTELNKTLALALSNPVFKALIDGIESLLTGLGQGLESQNSPAATTASKDLEDDGSILSAASPQNQQDYDYRSSVIFDPVIVSQAFQNTPVSSLNSSGLNEILEDQLEKIRLLTPDDLRQKRNFIANFTEDVENYFINNANSETGVDTSNVEILYALNEVVLGFDMLIAALEDSTDVREDDYNAFYRDFAISNGINFENSQSKFYVPFPYGSSLESLALNYLGNPDRWIEIAAINGLKAPYIDENGFEISLLNSAIGNSVTIADTSNLYIGQIVQVISDTKKPVSRKIKSIDQYSAIESIITFESVENETLSGYKLSDNARIKTFLPNTVNSLKLIAIPSQQDPTISGRIRLGAQIEDLNGIARTAKTDFLLNSDGDIVFTSGGDVKTASGLTNLIQAALIKLRTKTGYLIQHPEFGAGIEPGTSSSEIDVNLIFQAIKASFDEDERFSGILSTSIEKTGNAVNIKLLLGVAGSESLLPLETSIPI